MSSSGPSATADAEATFNFLATDETPVTYECVWDSTTLELCESPLALACFVNLVFIVTGSLGALVMALLPVDPALRAQLSFLLTGWPELTAVLVAILAGLAVLNLFGNLFLSRAYQTADSSLLAPLDFSYLLLVALWGRLLFESWPTPLAILGMSMIAAAGMITAIREQRRQRHQSASQEPG